MKKVLITGGAGFIGSNLCNFLLKKNFDITVFDNLSSGKLFNVPKKIKFFKIDIRNKNLLKKNFKNFNFVIHLAAIPVLQQAINNPKECIDINLIGTQNILEFCLKKNSKLIFASTCAVYPLDLKKKAKENAAGKLSNPYSISKFASENLISFYAQQKKLKCVILRFFNVYGSKQNPNSQYSGVIAKFIKNSKKNLNLELYNNGEQKRDFINVNDICEAIYKSFSYKKFDIFNVGTGREVKIKELAKIIVKYSKKGKIKKGKKTNFDAMYSCANINKIKKKMNFSPNITLEKGIKNLLNE
tara:strand:- start:514 stop:1413 length:900 start_codon:yes stop_codon:yes gene_type:complete